MGLTDDLCALTALNDEQLAGLARLAGMTRKEVRTFAAKVDRAWAANVQAVQDAKAALTAAIADYARVSNEAAAVMTPLNRKRYMGQLTHADVDVIEEQQARIAAAQDVVAAARMAHDEAKVLFKAGVE